MDSLSLMYQMGLKNSAAMSLPQQLQTEQDSALAKLKEQQLANTQSEAMNPLNQLFRQGEINQQGATLADTQAKLPGVVGQSQSLASQGQVDAATTGDRIAERKSTLGNQVGVDKLQTLAREGQVASMTAQALGPYPPAMHREVAAEIMKKYGVPEDSPLYHAISQLPPDKVAAGLNHIGEGMTKTSSAYIQSMALQDSKNRNDVQTTGMNNSTSIAVANINADAKVQAAKLKVSQMAASLGIGKTITALEDQKARNGGVLPPEYEQELQNLKFHDLSGKTVGANGTTATVLNAPTPMANAQAASRGPQPTQAPQAQAAPVPQQAPAAPANDLAAQAKAAGYAYEPDKYEYAVIGGALKRRPKR